MANLIIDIGNTALKASWCDGITLGKTFRYQGEKTMDFILSLTSRVKPEVMVLSSVRNFTSKNIQKLESECERLIIVDKELMSHYGLPLHLTPDRVASVVASRYLFNGRECMIFDFGTTLTVDFTDSEGKYEGGNVSLGYRTRFKSINRYSRNYPLIGVPSDVETPGNDLVSSVISGVLSGMIFEIEGYILHNPKKTIVFTGGDAIYFAKRMKNSIFAVCNLVLMGLAIIAVEYDKKVK
jgi:type III pantothenate kinase